MDEIIRNKRTSMKFNGTEITGADLIDQYNWPCCYSKSKRGIKKAWGALKDAWNDDMSMYQAMTILMDNKIRMHSYCAMD